MASDVLPPLDPQVPPPPSFDMSILGGTPEPPPLTPPLLSEERPFTEPNESANLLSPFDDERSAPFGGYPIAVDPQVPPRSDERSTEAAVPTSSPFGPPRSERLEHRRAAEHSIFEAPDDRNLPSELSLFEPPDSDRAAADGPSADAMLAQLTTSASESSVDPAPSYEPPPSTGDPDHPDTHLAAILASPESYGAATPDTGSTTERPTWSAPSDAPPIGAKPSEVPLVELAGDDPFDVALGQALNEELFDEAPPPADVNPRASSDIDEDLIDMDASVDPSAFDDVDEDLDILPKSAPGPDALASSLVPLWPSEADPEPPESEGGRAALPHPPGAVETAASADDGSPPVAAPPVPEYATDLEPPPQGTPPALSEHFAQLGHVLAGGSMPDPLDPSSASSAFFGSITDEELNSLGAGLTDDVDVNVDPSWDPGGPLSPFDPPTVSDLGPDGPPLYREPPPLMAPETEEPLHGDAELVAPASNEPEGIEGHDAESNSPFSGITHTMDPLTADADGAFASPVDSADLAVAPGPAPASADAGGFETVPLDQHLARPTADDGNSATDDEDAGPLDELTAMYGKPESAHDERSESQRALDDLQSMDAEPHVDDDPTELRPSAYVDSEPGPNELPLSIDEALLRRSSPDELPRTEPMPPLAPITGDADGGAAHRATPTVSAEPIAGRKAAMRVTVTGLDTPETSAPKDDAVHTPRRKPVFAPPKSSRSFPLTRCCGPCLPHRSSTNPSRRAGRHRPTRTKARFPAGSNRIRMQSGRTSHRRRSRFRKTTRHHRGSHRPGRRSPTTTSRASGPTDRRPSPG